MKRPSGRQSVKGTKLWQWWLCCVYFNLPNIINPMYIQYLREVVPLSSQNIGGVCYLITLPILYYFSSRLVTCLKVNDAPILVSDILCHTVSFKFINFSFQIFLLFVLKFL